MIPDGDLKFNPAFAFRPDFGRVGGAGQSTARA
jgi:hypothetical protein